MKPTYLIAIIGAVSILIATIGLLNKSKTNLNNSNSQNSAMQNASVKLLSAQKFKEAYEADSEGVLLDVRTQQEFYAGHISASKNIDFEASNFVSELDKLDKLKSYYVYCRSGNRSASATKMMIQMGFTKVYELENGIISWQAQNYPLVETLPE